MVTEQDIKRINELYHKSKEGSGLTEEEKAEQATLRRAYIDSVKANLGVYLKDIKNASKQSEQDAADAFDPKRYREPSAGNRPYGRSPPRYHGFSSPVQPAGTAHPGRDLNLPLEDALHCFLRRDKRADVRQVHLIRFPPSHSRYRKNAGPAVHP